MEQAIRLRTGAVDGLLDGGIGRGFRCGFDFAATAEAPEGTADFGGYGFFDGAGGAEFGTDRFVEGGPDGLFVGETKSRVEKRPDFVAFCAVAALRCSVRGPGDIAYRFRI